VATAACRRRLEFFGNAKVPNDKLVNFESSDSGATNCQSTDGHSVDGQCADSDCTQRERAKCLRCHARCSKFVRARSIGFLRRAAREMSVHSIANT
jgi:hypothetical protein